MAHWQSRCLQWKEQPIEMGKKNILFIKRTATQLTMPLLFQSR